MGQVSSQWQASGDRTRDVDPSEVDQVIAELTEAARGGVRSQPLERIRAASRQKTFVHPYMEGAGFADFLMDVRACSGQNGSWQHNKRMRQRGSTRLLIPPPASRR